MTQRTTELIDRYCEAWNRSERSERVEILTEVWVPDGVYLDPNTRAVGAQALADHIGGIREQRPGARALRTSDVDVHHRVGRFEFEIRGPEDQLILSGLDVFELDESEQRLVTITGFFNPPAAQ